jgi:hypothetical protein
MFKLDHLKVEDVHPYCDQYHRTEYRENGPPAFTVLRHPWRRFVSTWANKVYRPHIENTALIQLGARRGMELDDFCAWFIDLEPRARLMDLHIKPQYMQLPTDVDKVIRLIHEDLHMAWKNTNLELLYGTLDQRNHTRGIEKSTCSAYRTKIEDIYADDMELWSTSF